MSGYFDPDQDGAGKAGRQAGRQALGIMRERSGLFIDVPPREKIIYQTAL